MKITTKTGDDGSTGLIGGARISKSDLVIEVLGCLDELQAFLGWCKVGVKSGTGGANEVNDSVGSAAKMKGMADVIDKIQNDLYGIMGKISGGDKGLDEKNVKWIEELIEKYESASGGAKGFVKPGKNELSARFHVARTVCRRVERVFVEYMEEKGVGGNASVEYRGSENGDTMEEDTEEYAALKIILKYLNRLSDLLFLMGKC